jgi:hypothetical protein
LGSIAGDLNRFELLASGGRMIRFGGLENFVTGDKILCRRDELFFIPGVSLRRSNKKASDKPGAGYRYSAHINGSKPVHLFSQTGSAHLELQKPEACHSIG